MWVGFSFSGCFWKENTQETHSTLVGIWQTVSVNTVKQKQVQCMMPVHFWCKLTWQQQKKNLSVVRLSEKYSCRFCLFAWLCTVICMELLSNDMEMVFTLLTKCNNVVKIVYYNSWHADLHGCVCVWMKKCSPLVPENIKLFYRSSTNTEIKCNIMFVCLFFKINR